MKAIKKEYQSGGKFPEPILNITWDYPELPEHHGEPDIMAVAREMNGYNVADGSLLDSFASSRTTGPQPAGSGSMPAICMKIRN